MKSYCYVGRFNHDRVYVNENIDDILNSVDKWLDKQPEIKTPNQVDSQFYVIDIGCSTDIPLMLKHYDWQKVFDYFNKSPRMVKSSFATKYPTRFNPQDYELARYSHRIRVSLMPQKYSDILEPGTDLIQKRIDTIPRLAESMEVHINLSPIIYTEGWLKQYRMLFQDLQAAGIETKSECIFLTYNNIQFERNSAPVNDLLWRPDIQEKKDSEYASDNIRYQWQLKKQMIQDFTHLYADYFDPAGIRYIF